MSVMYPDKLPDALNNLLESSQRLHGELVRSVVWNLIKDEPIIVQWMNSLREVESILKPSPPEETKLYGTQA